MTKLQILSDLHLEAHSAYDLYELEPSAPYLALLGDIGNVRDAAFFEFLRRILKQYEIIFFVAGNHEPYHSDWDTVNHQLSQFATSINETNEPGLGKFVFMNKTRYDLTNDVTLLGCVLFSAVPPEKMKDVSFGLNDFYHIRNWTVEDHDTCHTANATWLNSEVQKLATEEPGRKVVILTHYCPTFEVTDPKYKGSNISTGFTTDMTGEVCWTSSNVVAWAFGHTHFNCDTVDKQTGKRVVANQRGYYFSQSYGFDAKKALDL